MLKREITFTDFNDKEVTETYYFNLSKAELLEMESEYDGGLSGLLQKIIDTGDAKSMVQHFKKIVLQSYGQKSPDGKRFIKSDQLREEFEQTPAYDVLFMELASDDKKAAIFINGIMPKDLTQDQDKPNGPPMPPTT